MDIETALGCFEFHATKSDADGSYWSDENDNDKHTDRDAMNEVRAHIQNLDDEVLSLKRERDYSRSVWLKMRDAVGFEWGEQHNFNADPSAFIVWTRKQYMDEFHKRLAAESGLDREEAEARDKLHKAVRPEERTE